MLHNDLAGQENGIILSLIVPVYNVEKYLEDCLKSLLAQDVESCKYEIICVNDGSTDGSLALLEKYAKEYSNIRIINKENGGVSSARNLGIKASRGKYIWFVDSDDLIKPNCLGQIFNIIEKEKPEMIECLRKRVSPAFEFYQIEGGDIQYSIINGFGARPSIFVTNTIVSSKIIKENKIHFKTDMKYGEDTLFQYYVYMFRKEERHIQIFSELYFYRSNPASATHNRSIQSWTDQTSNLMELARGCQQMLATEKLDNKKKTKNIEARQHLAVELALLRLPKGSLDYKETMQTLKNEKLYSYPMQWKKFFQIKGLKNKLTSIPILFFKFEFFYKFYYRFITKKYTKKD